MIFDNFKRIAFCALFALAGTLVCPAQSKARPDSVHHLSASATSWARGEIRDGALPSNAADADYAIFLMGTTTLRLDY